jgi:hypothetical protein
MNMEQFQYMKIQFVPHRKHVLATKTNRLMLFKETIAVYCENHVEHKHAVGGMHFSYVKVRGTYSNHSVLKG